MEKLNTVLKLVDNGNGNLKFPIKDSASFLNTPIELLKLDTRSHNAMIRSGIRTIGDIVDNLDRLVKIKGFGTKCLSRTMYEICAYQYNLLSEERKHKYLQRIVDLNLQAS